MALPDCYYKINKKITFQRLQYYQQNLFMFNNFQAIKR